MDSAAHEIAEIQRQMDQVRQSAGADINALVENTRALTDWRRYWRQHPWAWCGAATVLGYWLVPSRRFGNSDSQRLAELSQAAREKSSAPRQSTIMSELAGTALGILIQQGKQLVAQRVAQVFESHKTNRVPPRGTGERGTGGGDSDRA